jgi:OPT family oligopeptide transporter
MIADAFANLALSWRTVLNTFKPGGATLADGDELEPEDMRIPNSWWIIGLGVASIITMTVAHSVFGIPWWMTLIAVAMSSVLAMIATRSTGETDINPIGGMGKVTQLVFGAVAPGKADINILAAGITSAGASQSGDMMQDLKTGRLLGASPRNQVIAQLIGIMVGIPICAGVYKIFDNAYEIGVDESFPAPAAQAWKAMAELLSGGFDQLPPNAVPAIIAGAAFGTLLPVIRKFVKPAAPYVPSSLAMGIAFIVPAYYSVAMFLGSMMLVAWKRISPASAAALAIAVASGLIAGEGLTGVLAAIESIAGVPEGEGLLPVWQWITNGFQAPIVEAG